MQLQIDPTETTWEDHGWVAILNEEGEELARHERAQHNKTRFPDRRQIFAEMCASALASVAVVEGVGALAVGGGKAEESKAESKPDSESKSESKSDI